MGNIFKNIVRTISCVFIAAVAFYVAAVVGVLTAGAVGVLVAMSDLCYSVHKTRKGEKQSFNTYSIQALIGVVAVLMASAVFPTVLVPSIAVWVVSRFVSVPTLFNFDEEEIEEELTMQTPETEFNFGRRVDDNTFAIVPVNEADPMVAESETSVAEIVSTMVDDIDKPSIDGEVDPLHTENKDAGEVVISETDNQIKIDLDPQDPTQQKKVSVQEPPVPDPAPVAPIKPGHRHARRPKTT